ncbi:MAG: Gfo/Idh/MocA family oxidoreductase, partial [Betaproteobacteria bacterium]
FSYKFEVCGSAGMIEYDSLKARPLSVVTAATSAGPRGGGSGSGTGGGTPGGVAVPESPLKDREPYLREIRDFLAYVRGEGTPRVLPEDAVAALEISLAATRSALTGKVVSVS